MASRRKLIAAWLLVHCGLPLAFASEGDYSNGIGARSMALGGADVAFPEGPLSALGVNPAGLSLLKDPTLDAGLTSGVVLGHFSSRVSDNGELGKRFGIGPNIAFGLPLESRPVSFGIGIIPLIGLNSHWRYLDPPGGIDGKTSYGVQSNIAKAILLRTAVGMSIELSHWFSIGGALGVDYNENRFQTPYVFQTQPALRGLKTVLDLKTNGWGVDGSVGMLIRPTDQLAFGLSYQSPTNVDTHGTLSGNGKAQLRSLGGPFANLRPDFQYNAELERTYPQKLLGGVSWEFHPKWRLALQVDWINWSDAFDVLPLKLTKGNNADINRFVGANRFEEDTPLRWRDQVIYRAGVEYLLTDAFLLRCGYAYGRSPVPNETLTPLSAVLPEHTLTAGAGYRWRWLQVDLAYQWDLPTTRHIEKSALLGGEYSDSSTRIGIHWIGVTTSVHF
ncbi:MAG: outer membrane protein transport protein [Verrucomicrobiota bacterium]